MNNSIPKKETEIPETLNLATVLVSKKFNKLLITAVTIGAVLVILWG